MSEHRETDLGVAAAVTDRGLRHSRNEDDYQIAAHDDRVAVVVCDGVSSTANPDLASTAAVQAALSALEGTLTAAAPPGREEIVDALRRAVEAAQDAVAAVVQTESGGPDAAPSTTIVAVWCDPGRVLAANVGDSRAYWLSADGSSNRRLTRDHSWAEAAIASGVPEADAYSAPGAHVITGWLGAGAEDTEPHVTQAEVTAPGLLVVCTDGLWNYFEPPEALADLVDSAGGSRTDALAMARHLVSAANQAGGADNITVAVVPVVPQT